MHLYGNKGESQRSAPNGVFEKFSVTIPNSSLKSFSGGSEEWPPRPSSLQLLPQAQKHVFVGCRHWLGDELWIRKQNSGWDHLAAALQPCVGSSGEAEGEECLHPVSGPRGHDPGGSTTLPAARGTVRWQTLWPSAQQVEASRLQPESTWVAGRGSEFWVYLSQTQCPHLRGGMAWRHGRTSHPCVECETEAWGLRPGRHWEHLGMQRSICSGGEEREMGNRRRRTKHFVCRASFSNHRQCGKTSKLNAY